MENKDQPTSSEILNIEIKPIGMENWQEFRDLYLKLLESDSDAFADSYDEISGRTNEEWEESFKRRGKTFVAAEEGKFVGMGRINFYDELPGVPVLNKLGVLPEYRGNGIASRLVEAREKWAASEGAQKVRLYVFGDRGKTIEFSEKNGYKIVEVQKDGFQRKDGTPVDVVIMEKDL